MTTDWRPLTESEIATWPKARLGGALLWITVFAGLLALLLLAIFLVVLYVWRRDGIHELASVFRGDSPQVAAGLVAATSALSLMAWATLVFGLTLARARATPIVASVGAALVFCIDVAAGVASQFLILSQSGRDFGLHFAVLLPMIPRWLGAAVTTFGLIGYMLGGVRPNAYFRRRVAVPPS